MIFSERRWSRTFGDDNEENNFVVRSIIPTSDNDDFVIVGLEDGYYGVGYAFICRVNKEEIVWSKRMEIDVYFDDYYPGFFDVVETPDGGFLAVGSQIRTDIDTTILKLSKDGDLEYNYKIDNNMEARSVILRTVTDDSDNCDVYVSGGCHRMYKSGESFIYCLDSTSGNIHWGAVYPFLSSYESYTSTISFKIEEIFEDVNDHGKLVAIGTETGTGAGSTIIDNIIVFLLDISSSSSSIGTPIWVRSIEFSSLETSSYYIFGATVLISTLDGNVLIGGTTEDQRAFIGKLNIDDGSTIWLKKFLVDDESSDCKSGGYDVGRVNKLVEDSDGNIVGIGSYFLLTPHGDDLDPEDPYAVSSSSHIFVFNITSQDNEVEVNWASSTYFVPTEGIDKDELVGHVPSDVGKDIFIRDDDFLVATGNVKIEEDHSMRTFYGVVSRGDDNGGELCNSLTGGQHDVDVVMILEDLENIVNVIVSFPYVNWVNESSFQLIVVDQSDEKNLEDIPNLEFQKRCDEVDLYWFEILLIVLLPIIAVGMLCCCCCIFCCCLIICVIFFGLIVVILSGGGFSVVGGAATKKKINDSSSGDDNDDDDSSDDDKIEPPVNPPNPPIELADFRSKDFIKDFSSSQASSPINGEREKKGDMFDVDGYDINNNEKAVQPSAPDNNNFDMGIQMDDY